MSISIEKQIEVIQGLIDADGFISDDKGYVYPIKKTDLEAIKQTLEAEKKRRDTNVLLNGGRRG
jgi:hypothetical protein